MSDPTIPTTPEPATPAGELHRLYADRWDIAHVTLEVWVATYRSADGSHIRVLAGEPAELLRKVRDAEDAGPGDGGWNSGSCST
jgi:hypothetical protein